ncbi:MAG TPA: DUF1579 domain-containing protein [Acetobacteraceae bacterium]|nr:DUF1579 domain-containing protein [Acetobacteraceae bacterium]
MPDTIAPPADFDFVIGSWRVRHRRLKARLAGCTEWEEFAGTSTTGKTLGGFGNIEDNMLDLPAGPYRAVALRAFDPALASWSIWWLDGRYPHRLDPPVVGRFEGGVGTFAGDDVLDGRPIRIRFLWQPLTPDTCRWEQAFSADGSESWEVNWVMAFTRTA